MTQPEITTALQTYYNELEPRQQEFICLYGSSVHARENVKSDIDLFLVSDQPDRHLPTHLDAMSDFVRNLHFTHGRELDEEVPYANKLVYSTRDINDGTSLRCFDANTKGQIIVPAVEKTTAFLGSREIKLRLALNALTSPHLIIGNDFRLYRNQRRAAEIAMTLTGISLCDSHRFRELDILQRLSVNASGETEELHLGYKTNSTEVRTWMEKFIEASIYCLHKAAIITKANRSYYLASENFKPAEAAQLFTLKGDFAK